MHRLICLVLFCAGTLLGLDSASAQSGTLSGVVKDGTTDHPIPGVNVLIAGTLTGTITDASGRFLLANINEGETTVVVSALGFASASSIARIVPDSTTTLKIILEPVFLSLPNVEVVADRSLAERTMPASFNRIRSKDLDLTQPLGTEEALRSIPGVHIATDDGISNRTNIGIRGLYPRRSEKILLLEDGVPIQPALYLAPSAYYNPPTERLDAIEVIKNATNVRFGAGSLVGAVNYITRRPPVKPGGLVSVVGGSNGYFSSLAAYGGSALQGKLGAEVQLLFKRGDGFRENTSFDIYNGTGKLLYRPTVHTTLSFKANLHKENSQATYSALTPYMFDQDPTQNGFKHDWLETGRIAGDLNLEETVGDNMVILATAYANRFRRDWWRQGSRVVDASDVDSSAPENAMVRIGLEQNRSRLRQFTVYGLSPRVIAQFKSGAVGHTLETGFRLHRDEFDNVEIDTDRPDARADDFDAASFGDPSHPNGSKRVKERFTADAVAVYAEDRVTSGNVGLTAGLRIERYRQTGTDFYDRRDQALISETTQTTSTEVLPAIGVTVLTGQGTFFGGVFRGFVPLTSSFAFRSLVDDEGFELDENLKPEHSINLEVGFRSDQRPALNGSVAVFHNTVSNLVAAGRTATFQPTISNLGTVRYTGIELDGRVALQQLTDLPFILVLDAQATIIDSEIQQGIIAEQGAGGSVDVTGNEAPYAPPVIFRVGFSASIGGFSGAMHYNRIGQQFADFNNTVEETPEGDNGLLPSYDFLDMSALYHFARIPVQLSITVKNATNSIYRGSRLHRSSSGIFPGGFTQVNFGINVSL